MKGFNQSIVLTIVALFSCGSMACPQLSGQYTCYDDSSEFPMEVTQNENENGVTVYNIDDDVQMTTDGQPHDYVEENVKNGVIVSQCVTGKVTSQLKGDFVNDGGEKFGEMEVSSILRMENEDQLVIEQLGYYKFYGDSQDIDRLVVCDRD